MRTLNQSSKLAHVCYEIRGPVLEEAKRLEDEGHRILKLNIGNPAPFGFEAPERSSSTSSRAFRRHRAIATPRASSRPGAPSRSTSRPRASRASASGTSTSAMA